MKKKILLISIISTLVVGVSATLGVLNVIPKGYSVSADANVPEDPEEYDHWCTSWSKPGHVYFHYNRGDKNDYDNFCLWLWNQTADTEGTLWGYSGPTKISDTLTLKPMSDHFMTYEELGLQGSGTYKDKYGIIVDVDLNKPGLVGGKTGTPVDFQNCKEIGLLWVKKDSMGGKTHWTSDGGRETYCDDWQNKENLREVTGGVTEHLFFATGSLNKYTYYIGSGVPEVKVNPIDVDTTGQYHSKVDQITDNYGVSPTSEAFKKLGVGYQIFVASFRDSNGDGYGDIRGIIDSLDYLKDLGVDVLWLTPIQQSDSYHGYDISDYYAVDKRFGTIADYRELLFKAHQKGMKVLMDLVLNHTSKGNVWFTKSQWGVNSGIPGTETDSTGINWRNVYTWKFKDDQVTRIKRTLDPSGTSFTFGGYEKITVKQDAEDPYGPSWYRDGESNYYYYGKFGSGMPEINYECKDTRKLVIDMAKYWMSFGLDGFRLDAVKHIYMKDEVDDTGSDVIIRDVGTKRAYDDEKGQYIYQPYDYSSDQTKNVAWWKEFSNELKKVYPDCFLVGENFDGYGTRTAAYYQGLDSQFDFANYYHIPAWLYNGSTAGGYAANEASETYDTFKGNGPYEISNPDGTKMNVPGGKRGDFINGAFTSNHDVPRAINQANGVGTPADAPAKEKVSGSAQEVGRAKVHAAVTLLNPGVSWIYYGDELGMSSNTDQHKAKYGNENSMDIWYRQPMMWQDSNIRPKYKSGQYKFEYDDYNAKLYANGMGLTINNGVTSSKNEMYAWYKALTSVKNMYPDNATVTFEGSSDNVLVMTAKGNGKAVTTFISLGLNQNDYLLNPGWTLGAGSYTKIAEMGVSGMEAGSNFNAPYSFVSFMAN